MLSHPSLDILGISHNADLCGFLKSGKAGDDRLQLHSVVGRVRLSARKLFLDRPPPQQTCPTSWSGIAEARSVRFRDMVHYLGMLLKQ
jgi:hypothetical protein